MTLTSDYLASIRTSLAIYEWYTDPTEPPRCEVELRQLDAIAKELSEEARKEASRSNVPMRDDRASVARAICADDRASYRKSWLRGDGGTPSRGRVRVSRGARPRGA